MISIPIVSFDIEKLKININKRLEEDYKDKPMFSSVLQKVATDKYLKLKFRTGLVQALDDFDTMIQVHQNLPYKPIFRMLSEKNILVGQPMLSYSFEYLPGAENVAGIVIKNMTENSFLYKKIVDMFGTFSAIFTEEEKDGMYERFANELFDSVEEAITEIDYVLNDESATIDDIAKEVTYKITGSYYKLLEEEDTV